MVFAPHYPINFREYFRYCLVIGGIVRMNSNRRIPLIMGIIVIIVRHGEVAFCFAEELSQS